MTKYLRSQPVSFGAADVKNYKNCVVLPNWAYLFNVTMSNWSVQALLHELHVT